MNLAPGQIVHWEKLSETEIRVVFEGFPASSGMTLAEKFELVLSATPDASHPLAQFTPTQLATFEELIQWLHDYNLQRREKPDFRPEILKQLTLFEAVKNSQPLGVEDKPAGQGS